MTAKHGVTFPVQVEPSIWLGTARINIAALLQSLSEKLSTKAERHVNAT